MEAMDGKFHGDGQCPSLYEEGFHKQFPIAEPGL
jgi:hypothetical protein